MPVTNQKHYRDRLRNMRDRMLGEVDSVVEAIREDINSGGNTSHAPVHLADHAPENIDGDIAVLEAERGVLEEIQAALNRIDAGKFGICEECGSPIAEERLEAIPYVSRCIKCAARAS